MTASFPSMRGRVALVTGATRGIGLEVARELARAGACVVLTGRDAGRIEHAIAEVRSAAPGANVSSLQGDLSLQRDVRRLAHEFRERWERLDVLVNNAGSLAPSRRESEEGVETTWALNVVAPYLLAELLIPSLRAAGRARVVNVASDAHRAVRRIDMEDPELSRGWSPWRAYCQSKLALIMLTYELARRVQGSGVTANAVHPGMVKSNFFSNAHGRGQLLFTLMRPFMRSPSRGARPVLHVATAPQLEGVSGGYFRNTRAVTSATATYDVTGQLRLRELVESLVANTATVS